MLKSLSTSDFSKYSKLRQVFNGHEDYRTFQNKLAGFFRVTGYNKEALEAMRDRQPVLLDRYKLAVEAVKEDLLDQLAEEYPNLKPGEALRHAMNSEPYVFQTLDTFKSLNTAASMADSGRTHIKTSSTAKEGQDKPPENTGSNKFHLKEEKKEMSTATENIDAKTAQAAIRDFKDYPGLANIFTGAHEYYSYLKDGFEAQVERYKTGGLSETEAIRRAVREDPESHTIYLRVLEVRARGRVAAEPEAVVRFNSLVDSLKVQHGLSESAAIKRIVVENPEVHQAYVEAINR